jgi:aminopeptidase N
MANQILLISADSGKVAGKPAARTTIETMKVQWNAPAFPVSSAVGKPCPNLVFANEGDYAYGRFLLDPSSESFASSLFDPASPRASNASLLGTVSDQAAPLRRTMVWGALWDYVHVAKAPPRAYVELALKSLPQEMDESLARIQGARVAEALHSYLHEAGRQALAPQAESVAGDRMLKAPTLGLRIVSFRTFRSIAETPAGLQQVKDLLSGKLVVPGLTLKRLDRWELIGHLIAMDDPEAGAILANEKSRDHSGEAQKYAYAAQAGTPTAENKARYFDQYLHSQEIQEDWITESLRPFNYWKQSALTGPYLIQALNELPDIKLHRKIFFLMEWLEAFIEGQNSGEAQAVVQGWLDSEKIDPDLRLKVLQVFDSLERTVLIRKKFPD